MNISIDPTEDVDAYSRLPKGNEDGGPLGDENKTRLGNDTVTLVPIEARGGLWRVGAEWLNPADGLSHDAAKALYRRQIKVSRKAVVHHFNAQPACEAFEQQPLLRHFRPLTLTDECHDIGALRLRLCPVKGLIYEKAERL